MSRGSGIRDSVPVQQRQPSNGVRSAAGHADPYFVVPTAPIRGIESRALIAADSPNYWEVALKSAQPPWTGKRHRGVEG